MPKRMVYFRENRKDKIRWRLRPNSKVSVKVEFDILTIFSRTFSTYHKVFRGFHRHLKLLQPIEFDFWAKIPNRPVRNNFFLDPTGFGEKSEDIKSCESLKYGYNHFGSKRLDS